MRNLAIAAALILLAQTLAGQNIRVGVLVGIYNPGIEFADSRPPSGGSLRTVWIPLDQVSGAPRIETVEMPDLLIPRRSGFWQAGLVITCTEDPIEDFEGKPLGIEASVADHLWSTPVGRRPQVSIPPEERVGPCKTRAAQRCENDSRARIYWVWPDLVSLDLGERTECGVHPDWEPRFTVRSLDSLDKPLTVMEVLGATAEASFRSAQQTGEREFRAAWKGECEAEPFQSDLWYVERKDGDWKAIGWNKAHRLCGNGFDFEPRVDLSSMTGRTGDASKWRQMKTRMLKIVDAHFSPAGSWVLVATDNQLMIFPNAQSNKPVVTLPLAKFEKPIMVEWATGRNVSRWTDEVRRLRSQGRVEPVVH
jgi:hypothetical protein